ncbi:MAG: hypothetical protein ACRDF4_11650 [Rhabdochlamydiaceae bacterium]
MSEVSFVGVFIFFGIIASVAFLVGFTTLSAYYSFAIGFASKERLYRRRAFWTGLLSVGLVSLVLTAFFSGGTPSDPSTATKLSVIAYFVILAAWIDSTIKTAIGEDFIHRDTMRWSIARYPFLFIVGLVAPINSVMTASDATALTLASDVAFVLSVGFLAVGIVTLYVSGTRTTIRSTKSYLKYVGLAVVSFILQFSLPSFFPFDLRAALPLAATSYFLFKMARSLSPIKKLKPQRIPVFF